MRRMGQIRNTGHIAHCSQLPHCPRLLQTLQGFPARTTFLEACIAAAADGCYNRCNHLHSHHGDGGLLAGHSHRSCAEAGSP